MRAAAIRKAKGITQADLAARLGVEQPTISRLENGFDGVPLRLLRQVAEALDVSLAELFMDDRSAAEQALIAAFRLLPPDRQQGWLDVAQALAQGPKQA